MSKFSKESNEFKMFGEFYNYVKAHYEVQTTDEYWQKVIREGNEIGMKYKGTDCGKLAEHLVNAFVDFADEKFQSMKKGG